MNIRTLTVLLTFSVLLFSCKNEKKIKTITEKIEYEVQIKNNEQDSDWWIQNIEGSDREKFINLIFDAVNDKKIKIYSNDCNEVVQIEDVYKKIISYDTINTKFQDTVLLTNPLKLKNITYFKFKEKWIFDEKTLLITKNVLGYSPVFINQLNEHQIKIPLFWIIPDTSITIDAKNLITITPKIQYDVNIKNSDSTGEWYENNIEISEREYFINKILSEIATGKYKVFDFFDQPVDKDKIKQILHRTDTVLVENIEKPEIYDTKVITTDIDARSIVKIRFVEEWKINPSDLHIFKYVKAISLLTEVKDENGSIRGYTPLFWIYFDDNIRNIQKN